MGVCWILKESFVLSDMCVALRFCEFSMIVLPLTVMKYKAAAPDAVKSFARLNALRSAIRPAPQATLRGCDPIGELIVSRLPTSRMGQINRRGRLLLKPVG